ncbi:MAG: oligosaccharide flippase family protein [Pyrobaculum sp.]
MTLRGAIRGGFWLLMTHIVSSLFGFVYWLVMSSVVGAEAMGLAAVVISIGTLAITIASFGVNTGLLRYGGEALGRGDESKALSYFWSAVSFLATTHSIAAMAAILFSPLGALFIAATILLRVASAFEFYIMAMYRTEVLFVAAVVGGIAKLTAGFAMAGWGWVGVLFGYVVGVAIGSLIAAVYVLKYSKMSLPRLDKILNMLRAGVPIWAPNVLLVLGQQVGVLSVFTMAGAVQTGHLYVAQQIAGLVSAVAGVVTGLLTPALAAMDASRREAASKSCRLALALSGPIAAMLVAVPHLPLSILGEDYAEAAAPLAILALTSLPTVVREAAVSYLLAEKKFGALLILSTLHTAIQLALYFVLVPIYGSLGAALATLIASTASAAVSSIWIEISKAHVLAIAIPLALVPTIYLLPWFAVIVATLSVYLLYPRLGVVTREDIVTMAEAILGKRVNKIYNKYRKLIDTILS